MIKERRKSIDVIMDIFRFLGSELTAQRPTTIANKTNLNYNTCKRYLSLIEKVQSMPKLQIIKTAKSKLYVASKYNSNEETNGE